MQQSVSLALRLLRLELARASMIARVSSSSWRACSGSYRHRALVSAYSCKRVLFTAGHAWPDETFLERLQSELMASPKLSRLAAPRLASPRLASPRHVGRAVLFTRGNRPPPRLPYIQACQGNKTSAGQCAMNRLLRCAVRGHR